MEALQNDKQEIIKPSVIDEIEKIIENTFRIIELPLKHVFTKEDGKNLYGRVIFMPAGCVLATRIHKHQHQFVVSKGRLKVYDETTGKSELIVAPYHGITEPGTRRALHILEDTIWHTFHITSLNDPDEIVEQVSDRLQNTKLEEIML